MNLKAAARQEQILRAAAACFARKGFHQTTMDDIAREAGISAGLIYRHFASKEDLIIALVEAHGHETRAQLDQARQHTDLAHALAAFFAVDSQEIDGQPKGVLLVEVVAESLRNQRVADVVQRDDQQIVHGLADLIVQAQARGQVDPSLAPIEAAELLLALSDGMLLRLALASEHDDFDDATLNKTFQTLYTRFLGLHTTTEEEL
ncbi:MAG: TetR/AcrR family transcriptional regulator [Chloroflexales bacterium]|nr:TetR/AcrR family transcriptional regulator [Chloroflexales bacterium]